MAEKLDKDQLRALFLVVASWRRELQETSLRSEDHDFLPITGMNVHLKLTKKKIPTAAKTKLCAALALLIKQVDAEVCALDFLKDETEVDVADLLNGAERRVLAPLLGAVCLPPAAGGDPARQVRALESFQLLYPKWQACVQANFPYLGFAGLPYISAQLRVLVDESGSVGATALSRKTLGLIDEEALGAYKEGKADPRGPSLDELLEKTEMRCLAKIIRPSVKAFPVRSLKL